MDQSVPPLLHDLLHAEVTILGLWATKRVPPIHVIFVYSGAHFGVQKLSLDSQRETQGNINHQCSGIKSPWTKVECSVKCTTP